MKGKLYNPFKPDRERTHKYFVISVVDNESDAEKFEEFVSRKFMRSHLMKFVTGINNMSVSALDVIDGCLKTLTTYETDRASAKVLLDETLELAGHAADRAQLTISRATRGITAPSTDAVADLPPVLVEELEPVPLSGTEEHAALVERGLSGDEAVAEIRRMGEEMRVLRSRVIQLESAVHKMTASGLEAIAELPETHKSYKERIAYSLQKEIDEQSRYLFNLYLTFRETHKDKLTQDFKKENPTTSVAGIKFRGAHRSYEDATEQMKRIAKDDDYMDTYVAEGGMWYSLPIRTDHAGNIIYREEELGELLGTRMEETEVIKRGRREGRDVRH